MTPAGSGWDGAASTDPIKALHDAIGREPMLVPRQITLNAWDGFCLQLMALSGGNWVNSGKAAVPYAVSSALSGQLVMARKRGRGAPCIREALDVAVRYMAPEQAKATKMWAIAFLERRRLA